MVKKQAQYRIQGMNRDVANSLSNADKTENLFKYAYEIKNMRVLTDTKNNDSLVLVNELGTLKMLINDNLKPFIEDMTVIGVQVIGKYLVLFGICPNMPFKNYILRLHLVNDTFYGVVLYAGNLGFDSNYPIESVTCYENESIQKVYWTDGLNSPRMINVADSTYTYYTEDTPDNRYDFTPTMKLREVVKINKLVTGGFFPAGTIQYVLTYSNRYMQETNPFYISPLYYNIKNSNIDGVLDRGGKADEICNKAFKIEIMATDNTFDLVNIYSITTTEQNTRMFKRVATLNREPYITYIDTGTNGEILDSNEIAFLNEKWSLVCQTLNHKDNRLFVGNLESTNPRVCDLLKDEIQRYGVVYRWKKEYDDDFRTIRLQVTDSDYYPYNTQLDLNSFQMKTFKSRETYRFGVQLQDRTGKWTNVIWVGDRKNYIMPHYTFDETTKTITYHFTYGHIHFTQDTVNKMVVNDNLDPNDVEFVKIRPVVVFPNWYERETVCQGILAPTVYQTSGRYNNNVYAQSSWFLRPNAPFKLRCPQRIPHEARYKDDGSIIGSFTLSDGNMEIGNMDDGYIAEFRHNAPIPSSDNRNGEVYCNDFRNTLAIPYDCDYDARYAVRDTTQSNFYVDQSLVTLHSPELEFDANLQSYDLSSLYLRITGVVNWTSNKADIQLLAGSSYNNPDGFVKNDAQDIYHKPSQYTAIGGAKHPIRPIGARGVNTNGYKSLISGPFWYDYVYFPGVLPVLPVSLDYGLGAHIVYPFHKDSLNNWDWSDPKAKSNVGTFEYRRVQLSSKVVYNARYALANNYYNEGILNIGNDYMLSFSDIKLYNNQGTILLNPPANSGIGDSITYAGAFNRTINGPSSFTYKYKDWNNSEHTIKGVEHHFGKISYEELLTTDTTIYYDRRGDSFPIEYLHAGIVHYEGASMFGSIKHKWSILKHFPRITGLTDNDGFNTNYCLTPWLTPSTRAFVSMNYKSSPHAVIVLNNKANYDSDNNFTSSTQVTLPTIHGLNVPDDDWGDTWHYGSPTAFYGIYDYYENLPNEVIEWPRGIYWGEPFWNRGFQILGHGYGNSFLTIDLEDWKNNLIREYDDDEPVYHNEGYGWSLMGELCRKVDDNTRFGGTSEAAMESNIWYVAGEAVNINWVDPNDPLFNIKGIDLYWTEGDTYFQRYDHLKTYSPANVQNGIVEVASFMVETRINLDGRCDINRGRNYVAANNTNFNLMNMAYTQDNNMFTGHTVDSNWLDLDKYPNQVAWSIVKNYGEKIDSWCNISMATTLDFDGDKGVIRRIERFANELIVFQDNAISKINYNQNVQVATSTGTPIQIANSNAIEGKVYLTTNIGTRNKWSIVNTPTGIYFVDYKNIGIYKFNGQGLPASITDALGFRSFMIENIQQDLYWNPVNFGDSNNEYGDFVNYYDSVNGDIFFINKKNCLAFNEKLNAFTSFYSYEETPYFINFNDMGFFFKDKKIWKEHSYGYCNFFDKPAKDYYVTLLVNPSSHTDKIFDNVEYRSDVFNYSEEYMPNNTFRDIRVWNEYQDSDVVGLEHQGRFFSGGYASTHIPSNLKKKFRIWRINVPRNVKSRDRIRNPWTYIRLTGGTSKSNPYIYKHILHDVVVNYFE